MKKHIVATFTDDRTNVSINCQEKHAIRLIALLCRHWEINLDDIVREIEKQEHEKEEIYERI